MSSEMEKVRWIEAQPPVKRGGEMSASAKAFSLVELLVVIAVLGLLISIVVPSFTKAKMLAYSADTMSRIRGLSGAADMYYTEYRMYPGQDKYSIDRLVGAPGVTQYTGTQIMVQRLMGFWDDGAPASIDPWNPLPDSQRKMYADLKDDDLMYAVDVDGKRLTPEVVEAFQDRFPADSKARYAHAILYYPARLGRTSLGYAPGGVNSYDPNNINSVYRQADNGLYLNGTTAPNRTLAHVLDPDGPDSNADGQPDGDGKPLRAKEYIIIGSGPNGKFFDYDDEMNINR